MGLSHFGYGAAAGALYGLLPRMLPGPLCGLAVWAVSYLVWGSFLGLGFAVIRMLRHRYRTRV